MNVNSGALSQTGVLYIGSDKGMYSVRFNEEKWKTYPEFENIPVNRVKIIDYCLFVCSVGIYRSTNGGDSWDMDSINNYFLRSFGADNINNQYIVDYAYLYRKPEGTDKWEIVEGDLNAEPHKVTGVIPVRENAALAIVSHTDYYSSEDAGEHWEPVDMPGLVINSKLRVDSTGRIYFDKYNNTNILYFSDNLGKTWDIITNFPTDLINFAVGNREELIGFSLDSFYISTDRGGSWNNYPLNIEDWEGNHCYDMVMLGDTIYARMNYFEIIRSTDKGHTWHMWYDGYYDGNSIIDYWDGFFLDFVAAGDKVLMCAPEGIYMTRRDEPWQKIYESADEHLKLQVSYDGHLYKLNRFDLLRSKNKVTSVEEEVILRQNDFYNIYPNPVSSQAEIRFVSPVQADTDCSLFDIEGRKILELGQITVGANSLKIDLGGLPSAVYYIRFSDGINVNWGALIKK